MKRVLWIITLLCAAAALVVSCTSDSGAPTTSSPVPSSDAASAASSLQTRDFSKQRAPSGPQSSSENEDFNCTSVGEVHVRFSDPGYVRDNTVGLFVSISRIPDTKMTLRVMWDIEGAPDVFEDIPFDDDDLVRDDGLLNLKKVIEHTYPSVNVPTRKRVRVELILADQTGNCTRVRDVTLTPAARGGGVLITPPGEAFGHHGACSGWNQCGDADTCALWACQAQGYSQLVSWDSAKPCTQWTMCHLFFDGPNNGVDYNWGNWCDVMGVGGIRCK